MSFVALASAQKIKVITDQPYFIPRPEVLIPRPRLIAIFQLIGSAISALWYAGHLGFKTDAYLNYRAALAPPPIPCYPDCPPPQTTFLTHAKAKLFLTMLRNTLLKGRAVNWAITAWLVLYLWQTIRPS